MKFGSVCSGIEAASGAWQPLGWKAQWFSEIEPFPCALLKHHYPTTPNLGDMTKFESWPTDDKHAIDLLCGGTPCQSFSVAGLRAGLDDPRGNLMLTFGAIAAKYRPQWLVWENVPGVLSSNGGRDFGTFLGMLGQLGYGFAYRVLDAQYFGVAQRRRRVFVVGHIGDWRRAAAVLFERHSLQGHPAPRREAGKVAPTIPSRSTAGGGLGTDFDCDGGLIQSVSPTLDQRAGRSGANSFATSGGLVPVPHAAISPALKARDHKGVSSDGDGDGDGAILVPMLAHSLRGEGFDASEDGTGRGTPLVPVTVPTIVSNGDAHSGFRDEHGLIAFDTTQITSAANYSNPQPGDPCHPLAALAHVPAIAFQGDIDASTYEADANSILSTLRDRVGAEAVAEWGSRILDSLQSPDVLRAWLHGSSIREQAEDFQPFVGNCPLPREEGVPARAMRQVWEHGPDGRTPQGRGLAKQLAFELGEALQELSHVESFGAHTLHRLRSGAQGARLLRKTLSEIQEVGRSTCDKDQSAHAGMQVRRLTPTECERLMGFPDSYTLVPHRGKPAADGPRYKALGNSWAVPNVLWIGRRIDMVDQIHTLPTKSHPLTEMAAAA